MVDIEDKMKGRVCVTGGTGFLGSWLVKRLLEDGYSVNTTIRMDPERKRNISYLTDLPGASERLHIFNADLDKPETFAPAIEGCVGVFHTAHPLDFDDKETEEVKIKRATTGLQGILQACVDSKTVKRVIYTSSIATVAFSTSKADSNSDVIDENCWTDVELVRSLGTFGGSYIVTKTITEKSAIEFAERNGLDLVTVLPCWITGPFICSHLPDSVHVAMALILGNKENYQYLKSISLVHIDDVARAHIHLFEYPEAKGRYLCVALKVTIEELCELISARYPEYQLPTPDSLKDLVAPTKQVEFSNKKLKETGFKYENELEKMFDGSIKCCKEKGLL
ncbi:hypothetical protein BUALT_Bualt01G0210500 [Buddleja alternifolia]|uniref:Dihydroflavonol 4-reductase n=1 Tax=Buddleja alternifolia TaxID=168488 RepID=A0AAV6Y902_9LAMI|nr:hypothetical protein BUALT_Bualt01G0210500 [Buddleja alternifolia]